jgi:tRNA pseudouridine38-40 synthase
MKILIKISYLGTNYCGFQVQKNGVTVQQRLQDAIEAVFGFRCPLCGCGRTDSGVHANMFYCTIDTLDALNAVPLEHIPGALNHNLPHDISVCEASEVNGSFHPRYDVRRKEYLYLIWNERAPNPFFYDRTYHCPRPLDNVKMNEAASYLTGRHDFAAFMAAGSTVTDTVREIYRAEVLREGSFVRLEFEGDGFLYNMVRIITGTLIYISEGKISPDEIPQIIKGKNRNAAGFTAPAQGLYLNKVVYKENV